MKKRHTTSKKIILAIAALVIIPMALYLTSQKYAIAQSASSSVGNPTKLFSLTIGTSTADGGANIGVFVDERTMSTYNKFYFPASFAVDKDSNMVMVLDSIRNRVAMFSLSGQYLGQIKLPFNIPAIDFTWFPKTETMIFVFQNSPDIGILNINTTQGFSIKSSSAFRIPQVASTTNMANEFMNVWPINILNSTDNYFVLSALDQSSDRVLVQASSTIHQLKDISSNINGMIGSQSQTAVVGYGNGSSSEILVQNLETNQVSQINISTSTTGIQTSYNGNTLATLQLVGGDENRNFYIEATYPSNTMEVAGNTVLYEINQMGAVIGNTEVFPSPQMLTNRYLFIDPYGSIFYMRADNQNTISFYQFGINGSSTSTLASSSQSVGGITTEASRSQQLFSSIKSILLAPSVMIILILLIISIIFDVVYYSI